VVFNQLRDKKVVGVFVRFRAPFTWLIGEDKKERVMLTIYEQPLKLKVNRIPMLELIRSQSNCRPKK
jgi:hypothetical protein